jgi:hypothetical protein
LEKECLKLSALWPIYIKIVWCCRQQPLSGCQELEVEKTMLEKQLEISEDQLEKLLLDGKELVRWLTDKYIFFSIF